MKQKLYFEDFVPGSSATYGALPVERAEIIAYAAQYDPQPMHLDEAAGAKSLLGGLAASGWQSCASCGSLPKNSSPTRLAWARPVLMKSNG